MLNEQMISVAGQALNVAVGLRQGVPAVLLHGVVRRWQDFSNVLPTLAARTQPFAVDQRGHGKSARGDRYLVADYVADATAFVRTLESPAVLVGHSLGAVVALGVAAALPDRVRAIVLEDPPSAKFLATLKGTAYDVQWQAMHALAGSTRPLKEMAAALADVRLPGGIRVGDVRDAAALRFLARCLRDLDPAVLTPVLEGRWLAGFDPLAAAALVKCPALLLAADVSVGGMLPGADADALAAALADPVRVDLPRVGHLIHGTLPDGYLRLTSNFLDSLE